MTIKGPARLPSAYSSTVFPPRNDFSSLSIRDLLDAREAYHVYLSSLQNVIATGIGRYRINQKDWYADNPPSKPRPRDFPRIDAARTLENSVVRAWSWPCVLVFVNEWEEVPGRLLDQAVPPRLYLPDGRIVPTCVVLSKPPEAEPPASLVTYVSDLLGGGYTCVRDVQGTLRRGTIGCLVQREGTFYALTNRHVAGPDEGVIEAVIRGQRRRIGTADPRAANRVTMHELFPRWPGERTLVNVDAGLIRVDDIEEWTSQIFGIGEVGELFNATPETLTLDIIGCPVRAFGGVSGVLEGEIQALFFRYKSVGGYDYVSDVLIGRRGPRETARDSRKPKQASTETQAGDSGTIWFYDPPLAPPSEDTREEDGLCVSVRAERGERARRLRPIAMQWGAHRVAAEGGSHAYALATFASTVCRVLDVEIVRGYAIGYDEYWGKIGHFSIGWKACDVISNHFDGKLKQIMTQNQRSIGFDDETLSKGSGFRLGRGGFVPLADVPDYVWVFGRPNEGPQHFADVDVLRIDGTLALIDACLADPRKISAAEWKSYFDGFEAAGCGPDEGVLPFRVWQLWDAMIDAARDHDGLRFVTAAGVLAHYVGDASQPLHGSYLHHGRLPTKTVNGRKYPVRHESAEYKVYHDTREAQIHSVYESVMLEIDPAAALAGVDAILAKKGGPKPDLGSGWQAARALVDLMGLVRKRLPATEIIDADQPEVGPKARARRLWETKKIREGTIASLAESSFLLARMWASAWVIGGGDEMPQAQIRVFTEDELEDFYRRKDTLAAMSLSEMVNSGRFEPK